MFPFAIHLNIPLFHNNSCHLDFSFEPVIYQEPLCKSPFSSSSVDWLPWGSPTACCPDTSLHSLKKFGHFSGFDSLLAISYILSFPICFIVHSIISSSSFPWVSAWKVHKYVWVLEFLKNVFILLSFLISSLAEYRVVHQMSFTLRIFKTLLQSLLSFTIVLRRLIQLWLLSLIGDCCDFSLEILFSTL